MNNITSAPAVSVIVPVYNSERYLRQCMDSIVGQTLKDIEIICVNDGSTDESPKILRKYAEKDPRIIIIDQENQSQGPAKNNGFEVSKGQYIIFWDSDDYFELDALEIMYGLCSEWNADLCVCNAQDFDDVTGENLGHDYLRRPYPETGVFCASDCPDRIFDFSGMVGWNHLVRRSMWADNGIRFPSGSLVEDISVTMQELLFAERITTCRKRLIHYRVNRSGSLTNDYSKRANAMIEGCEEAYGQLTSKGLLNDPAIFRSFLNKVAGLYLYSVPLYGDFEQFSEYYKKMFYSEEGLLRMWDSAWESMPDAEKFLEAKSISPEEFLFRQVKEMTERDKMRRREINELEAENRKLIKAVSSRTYRYANALSAPLKKAKDLVFPKKQKG